MTGREAEMTDTVRRRQILTDLEHLGISGREANFIELIPLVEMVWADGKRQECELAVLDNYIARLIARLNQLSPPTPFTTEEAETFALRFLRERPSPELLSVLRNLAVELSTDKDALLKACIDIAATCVVEYPYALDERFNPEEKRTFFEILEAVEHSR
jgi:hypothetical protein